MYRIPLDLNFECMYSPNFELISHFDRYLKWYTVSIRPLSCCWTGCHNCAIIDKDEHTVTRPLQSIPIYDHQSYGTHKMNILTIWIVSFGHFRPDGKILNQAKTGRFWSQINGRCLFSYKEYWKNQPNPSTISRSLFLLEHFGMTGFD